MTLTKKEAQEYASQLPEGISFSDKRARIVGIEYVMCHFSDERHPLSVEGIREIIRQRDAHNVPSPNTVSADIKSLVENGVFGYKLQTTRCGSYAESTRFSEAGIRMLSCFVRSCTQLSDDEKFGLEESLGSTVSIHQADESMKRVWAEEHTAPDSLNVLAATVEINRAIREHKKLEFVATQFGFDGKRMPLNGDNGKALRVETPIALFFDKGCFYLESYSNPAWRYGMKVARTRLDKLIDVRVSSEDADDCMEVRDAKASLRKRAKASVRMMDGPLRTIFLRVRNGHVDDVFDQFGFDQQFDCVRGGRDESDTTALTCIRVCESPALFQWLTGVSGGVVLEKPSPMAHSTGPWSSFLKREGISFEKLVEDHSSVLQGFFGFLNSARAAYNDAA